MLNRGQWLTGFELDDAICSPEPYRALLLCRPRSQIPAVTIPQESERFYQHRTFPRSVGRGIQHQHQLAVKDRLKKGTDGLALPAGSANCREGLPAVFSLPSLSLSGKGSHVSAFAR